MELITVDPRVIAVREGLPRIREEKGDISGLAQSIKEHGQIQPILVTYGEGTLELVAGGRRLLACLDLKREIHAVVKETCTDIELKRLELEENLQRLDLSWQERSRGTAELHALMQKEKGESQPGRSTRGLAEGQKGHDLKDTASIVKRSYGTVHADIELAKAMEAFPEIAGAKTAKDAKKMLDKIEETIILDEIRKRKGEESGGFMYAENHYIIGDAIDNLKSLASNICDFANVDTPYGIDLVNKKKSQVGTGDLKTAKEYTEWEASKYWETIPIVAKEVYRILKPNSWMLFWYGQEWYEYVYRTLLEAGFGVDKIPAVWYGGRGRAQTMQPEINLARSYEVFFVCRKGTPIFMKRGIPNVFAVDKLDAQYKIHPTEKPLALMQEILKVFLSPGSKGIVPFLGSGNDLRAMYSLDSLGFGFELNNDLKTKFLLRVEEDIKSGLYTEEDM